MPSGTPLDTLFVRIEGDTKPLTKALKQANVKVSKSSRSMSKGMKDLDNSSKQVGKSFFNLRTAAVALGVVLGRQVLRAVKQTSGQFQDLEVSLSTVFGGIKEGEAALDKIKEFAITTPFQVETLTKSFIQLGNAGIAPTTDLMNVLGDAASATTNRLQAFQSLTTVVQRASEVVDLVELNKLNDVGLPVFEILRQELNLKRNEITEHAKTAEGAQQVLHGLITGLNKRFGGQMERLSENLTVAESNLEEGLVNLRLAAGEGIDYDGTGARGIKDASTDLAIATTKLLEVLEPEAAALGSTWAEFLDSLTEGVKLYTEFKKVSRSNRIHATGEIYGNHVQRRKLTREDRKHQGITRTSEGGGIDPFRNLKKDPPPTAAIERLTDALKSQRDELKAAEIELAGYSSELVTAFSEAELLSQIKIGEDGSILGISDEELEKAKEFANVLRLTNEQQAKIEAGNKALEDRDKRLENAIDIINANTEGNSALKESFDDLSLAVSEFGLDSLPEAQQALANLTQQMEEDANPILKTIRDSFEEFGGSLSDTLADALVEGEISMDKFADVAKGFVKTLLSEFIRLYAIKSILNSIVGAPAIGPTPTPVNVIPTNASGGKVQGNKPTLVGERGPEIFIPNSVGNIRNAHDTRSMSGESIQVNQNFEIQAGVSQTIKAEFRNMLPEIKQLALESVAEATQRGGTLSDAIRG